MSLNERELFILESLTLNEVVRIKCKILELCIDKEFMDSHEYTQKLCELNNSYYEISKLHGKIFKLMEE